MVHWWILGAGFPIDMGDHGGCRCGYSKETTIRLWARQRDSHKSGPQSLRRLESLRLKFTNEPSIFCRWGFGWVDKAQCFRSARRFGAVGSSQDFSRVFHGMALLGLCLETFFHVNWAASRKMDTTCNDMLFQIEIVIPHDRCVILKKTLSRHFTLVSFSWRRYTTFCYTRIMYRVLTCITCTLTGRHAKVCWRH